MIIIAFRKTPSPLEYFSYNLCFLTFLAGPTVTYWEYIDFITGDNVKSKRTNEVSNTKFNFSLFIAIATL